MVQLARHRNGWPVYPKTTRGVFQPCRKVRNRCEQEIPPDWWVESDGGHGAASARRRKQAQTQINAGGVHGIDALLRFQSQFLGIELAGASCQTRCHRAAWMCPSRMHLLVG